jgi:hypothetical protein
MEQSAVVRQTRNGAESSNPFCSTIQSLDFRTSGRIARNPRVCARFAIARGPGERLRRRQLQDFGKTYPRAIYLGPSAASWSADSAVQAPARDSPDHRHARRTTYFQHGSDRATSGDDGGGAEAPPEKEISREHRYETPQC